MNLYTQVIGLHFYCNPEHNKALVRTQIPLRFICAAQLGRYAQIKVVLILNIGMSEKIQKETR